MFRLNRIDLLPAKQMIAKYNYNSRELSPNVDAEQVKKFDLCAYVTLGGIEFPYE